MNKEEIEELDTLRDNWMRNFFHASLKGFFVISFVLISNLAFIYWYLITEKAPVHWSYFAVIYVLLLPFGMLAFAWLLSEEYPTEKRYKDMKLMQKLQSMLSNDKTVYF